MTITNRVFLTLALAGVCSTANAVTPPSPLISQAKKTITAELTDPNSAQFRGLRVVHGTVQNKSLSIVCGEFNSRNRMGGYIGFARFAYEPTILQGVIALKPEGGFETFGDAIKDRSDEATENKARVLAICLGGS